MKKFKIKPKKCKELRKQLPNGKSQQTFYDEKFALTKEISLSQIKQMETREGPFWKKSIEALSRGLGVHPRIILQDDEKAEWD